MSPLPSINQDTSNLRQNGWRDGYPLQNGHKSLDRSSRESKAPPFSRHVVSYDKEEVMSGEKMIVWSTNGENYSHLEKHDALEDAFHAGFEVGGKIFFGEASKPDPANFLSADRLIEDIGNNAYDNHGEFAESYPDVTAEAQKELEDFLNQWVRKHCEPSFWEVDNCQDYIITAEDFSGFSKV